MQTQKLENLGPMSCFWNAPNERTSVTLVKTDGSTLCLTVGDFITFDGRIVDPGVRIEYFTFNEEDQRGPSGLCYLPWREKERRWAQTSFSLHGNHRHLICHPVGSKLFGQHVYWDSVKHLNLGLCPIEDASDSSF